MKQWNRHYTREKAALSYPDENLVRLLLGYLRTINNDSTLSVLDCGSGSGRHIKFLKESGIRYITALDPSENSCRLSETFSPSLVIQGSALQLPFKTSVFDIIIAWGSLHYDTKKNYEKMIFEIHRALKPGGRFFATLRSDRDTFLRKGNHLGNNTWQTSLKDIEGSTVSFFSREELIYSLNSFSDVQYGISERSVPGNLNSTISHWIISAEK